MKRILSIIISLIALLGLKAQECSSLWITCPDAYIGQYVAYSHTYSDLGELSSGSICVATTGYFRLYVNGRMVSVPSYPLIRAPYRQDMDKTLSISCKFDVSRYLRNDSNTITLLSCPSSLDETPAFSLRFSGSTQSGKAYSREADESWLCSPLNLYLTDYNAEYVDGAELNGHTNDLTADCIMNWIPAERTDINLLDKTKSVPFPYYEYINKVIKPAYFSPDSDKKGVLYDFGNGFYGLIRVTFQDTKTGQIIYVAGSKYVCRGVEDEQLVLRFTPSCFRQVYISGDKWFRLANIEKVEGLQVAPISILVP